MQTCLFVRNRPRLLIVLGAVVALGVFSRGLRTNTILFDKYLGDGLYAVMLYALIALLRPAWPVARIAVFALLAVLVIECFQLTLIPQILQRSEVLVLRLAAIALGTVFSWLDIVAYLIGIAACVWIDFRAGAVRLAFGRGDRKLAQHSQVDKLEH